MSHLTCRLQRSVSLNWTNSRVGLRSRLCALHQTSRFGLAVMVAAQSRCSAFKPLFLMRAYHSHPHRSAPNEDEFPDKVQSASGRRDVCWLQYDVIYSPTTSASIRTTSTGHAVAPGNNSTPVYCNYGFLIFEAVMKSLLDDWKYADMTISCHEHDFNCHRSVICSQSPFFDAALIDGFKVTGIMYLPFV